MKTIIIDRHERVWESREAEFSENDWEDFKKWTKGYADKADQGEWYKEYALTWERIKDMTWDEAYEDFKKYKKEGGGIHWTVSKQATEYSKAWSYEQYLGKLLIDEIRQLAYDSYVYDREYTDDYDEEFTFEDTDKHEGN